MSVSVITGGNGRVVVTAVTISIVITNIVVDVMIFYLVVVPTGATPPNGIVTVGIIIVITTFEIFAVVFSRWRRAGRRRWGRRLHRMSNKNQIISKRAHFLVKCYFTREIFFFVSAISDFQLQFLFYPYNYTTESFLIFPRFNK